jgi:hypothetical protein
MSRSRHHSEPDAFAPPARSLCLLLSWGANPSLPREGRAHATTRPRVDGRSRGGIRGSWRPSPSVRATRSLTRCVTSRMAATVSDMGDLRPRTNRHAQRPSRRQSRSNVARFGSRSAVPSRRWSLFGDGHPRQFRRPRPCGETRAPSAPPARARASRRAMALFPVPASAHNDGPFGGINQAYLDPFFAPLAAFSPARAPERTPTMP